MKLFYCKKCLIPSTRPRIQFNEKGVCNGCDWFEKKKTSVNWDDRWKELESLCEKFRSKDGSNWDVIVPCSFGKDSYHIAYNMKHKLNMNPLLVYVSPLIPTEVGARNRDNLIKQGYDCLQVHLNGDVYRRLCKKGFIEQGRPQMAFVTGISTAVIRIAMSLGVKWLMYGEEGESEYAGRMDYANKTGFDRKWAVETYFSGHDTSEYIGDEFSVSDLKWWHFPDEETLKKSGIHLTHWSYFENWDHLLHRDTALKLGFQRVKDGDINDGVAGVATYTNYSSLDDPFMRTFHTYLMFLKFGYGRGTHEASNDVKAGEMTREEGIEIAKKYDSYDCADFKNRLLKVFDMTAEKFDSVIDKWANKALLEKKNGKWQLKKDINPNVFIENAIEIDWDGKY